MLRAKILARWFTEKTEVSNEQAESVEHVNVRSTESKTGKPRLLNTEPLPGWGGGLNNCCFSIFSAQIIEKINLSAFEPLTLLTQGETSAS